MSSVNSIASEKLVRLIGTPKCPALVDVRADDEFSADPRLVPGSVRRSSDAVGDWAAEFRGRSAVVICDNGDRYKMFVIKVEARLSGVTQLGA